MSKKMLKNGAFSDETIDKYKKRYVRNGEKNWMKLSKECWINYNGQVI